MSLHDFWEAQPLRGMKDELTLAEVAALRLYTGPVFESWNHWLRYDAAGEGLLSSVEGECDW
jgi:hypothetical protein